MLQAALDGEELAKSADTAIDSEQVKSTNWRGLKTTSSNPMTDEMTSCINR
jgi:hypothetical protein